MGCVDVHVVCACSASLPLCPSASVCPPARPSIAVRLCRFCLSPPRADSAPLDSCFCSWNTHSQINKFVCRPLPLGIPGGYHEPRQRRVKAARRAGIPVREEVQPKASSVYRGEGGCTEARPCGKGEGKCTSNAGCARHLECWIPERGSAPPGVEVAEAHSVQASRPAAHRSAATPHLVVIVRFFTRGAGVTTKNNLKHGVAACLVMPLPCVVSLRLKVCFDPNTQSAYLGLGIPQYYTLFMAAVRQWLDRGAVVFKLDGVGGPGHQVPPEDFDSASSRKGG